MLKNNGKNGRLNKQLPLDMRCASLAKNSIARHTFVKSVGALCPLKQHYWQANVLWTNGKSKWSGHTKAKQSTVCRQIV